MRWLLPAAFVMCGFVVDGIGIEAAECPVVSKARVLARAGQEGDLVRGKIVGSNEGATTGFRDLGEIKEAPAAGQWVEIALKSEEPYRWVKYEAPDGSWGNVAEVEFYGGNRKLSGAAFGTNGSRDNSGNTFEKALDGDADSFFEGVQADGQYVGLDFGEEAQTVAPVFEPAPGSYEGPVEVKISCPDPSAAIRFSESQIPSRTKGNEYRKPVRVEKSGTVAAIAYAPGKAASAPAFAAYRIGEKSDGELVRTYHIGNSLTDTLVAFFQTVSTSLGAKHDFRRFTIPGAPTDWLWNHQDSGFGETPSHILAGIGVNHVCTQPFAGHGRSVKNEAEYSGKFYAMARARNADVQPWLYVQWPGPEFDDRWAKGRWEKDDATLYANGPKAATSWQEGCRNHMLYTEAVREEINRTWPGKPVRIIPTAAVLAAVKDAVDAGQFDGVKDFFGDLFSDGIHLKPKGAYIVTLTAYASIFGKSPEGEKDIATRAGYTPEQALWLQRLVWKIVSEYPHAGVVK